MLLKNISPFPKQLLAWYKKNARDLPWRRTKDPYKIWISEIMLQQTQVQTVIPYYERWLKRFPDIQTLAKAPEPEVMKHWAGLGYYRRARMIHEAAKWIVQEKAGRFPGTGEELLKLPGIGRYTAGAIASIAYGEKMPVLDGNVIRILTRLFAIKEDIGRPQTIEKLWGIAAGFLENLKSSSLFRRSFTPQKSRKNSNDIGDFNQAMMELGAMVCLPRNPLCLLCPVAGLCEGRKKGRAEDFPYRKNRQKPEKIKTAALILRNKESVLLQKQAAKERWGGLWVFPFGSDLKKLCVKFSLSPGNLQHQYTVRHGFTKYQVTLEVYEHRSRGSFTVPSGEKNLAWFPVKKISALAFPSPHQKITEFLLKNVS